MVKDKFSAGSPQPDNNREHTRSLDNDVFGRNLNKNRQKKRGRIWKGLGIVALITGAAGFGLSRTTTGKMAIDGGKAFVSIRQNPDLIFDRTGRDHVNILLIGRDVNWKVSKVYDPKTKQYRPYQVHDEEAPARSDTMIIVSLDKSRNTIRMVSLPRDAIVHMPDNPDGVSRAKLNAAHSYGGPAMLMRTIHDELGITIDRYAVIKFEGFKKLIDQVGGVDVDVDGALKRDSRGKMYRGNLDYDDNWGNLHIHLKPGRQRLTGDQAHSYVRFRMDLEGDPGRIRRQQQVMRALAKEIMHASIFQIPGLVHEVRRQFETDLPDDEIASAAYFAKNIGDPSKIQPITLFGSYYRRGSIRLNKPKNEKLLAYIFGPTFNPANFLANSPWTRGDEIGPTNNASPAALAILREAGVIKPEDIPNATEQNVPIRAESTEEEVSSSRSEPSSRRRRSRIATRDTESSSSRDDNERSSSRRERRAAPRRRVRADREETSERKTSSRRLRVESPARETSRSESPIPVPEGESLSDSSEGSSLEVEQ